jgi:hypothetical protein
LPVDELLFKGLYPPVYDRPVSPDLWYDNYVSTYVERDVRQVLAVKDLVQFQRFVRLCAGRTGQLLNLSNLGDDAGVSHNTAREWISVLEAGFVLFRLPPHHASFSRRIVRTPKLYFWRDRSGLEIDALIDLAGTLHPVEVKSGATITDDMFRALKRWRALAGAHAGSSFLLHGGSQRQEGHAATVLPWNDPVPAVIGGS